MHHFDFSHHKHSVLNSLHVSILKELLVIQRCCCSGQPARVRKQEESMEAKLRWCVFVISRLAWFKGTQSPVPILSKNGSDTCLSLSVQPKALPLVNSFLTTCCDKSGVYEALWVYIANHVGVPIKWTKSYVTVGMWLVWFGMIVQGWLVFLVHRQNMIQPELIDDQVVI